MMPAGVIATETSAPAIGRRRWAVAALLGLGVVVSYGDRVVLAIAAPAMQAALRMDDLTLGILLSAFGWTYGASQLPAGLLLDRYGVRRVLLASIALWAAAALMASLAAGAAALFAARALLGIAEAPTFPASAKAVGLWFPRQERGLATACFDGAAKFANVASLPVVAVLVAACGWRWAFVAAAALSTGFWLLFFATYRHPDADRRLGGPERRYIAAGGAAMADRDRAPRALRRLIGDRSVAGLSLAFGCYSYAFAFFLGWLPTFVARTSGTGPLRAAALASVPWLAATASALLSGGWLIDRLVAAGFHEIRLRKAVIAGGLAAGTSLVWAGAAHSPGWMLAWVTLSLSGLATASPALWSLPALIAPRGAVGAASGIMNLAGSLMGVAASILTGLILRESHSFELSLVAVGGLIAIGLLGVALIDEKSTPPAIKSGAPEISD